MPGTVEVREQKLTLWSRNKGTGYGGRVTRPSMSNEQPLLTIFALSRLEDRSRYEADLSHNLSPKDCFKQNFVGSHEDYIQV